MLVTGLVKMSIEPSAKFDNKQGRWNTDTGRMGAPKTDLTKTLWCLVS